MSFGYLDISGLKWREEASHMMRLHVCIHFIDPSSFSPFALHLSSSTTYTFGNENDCLAAIFSRLAIKKAYRDPTSGDPLRALLIASYYCLEAWIMRRWCSCR